MRPEDTLDWCDEETVFDEVGMIEQPAMARFAQRFPMHFARENEWQRFNLRVSLSWCLLVLFLFGAAFGYAGNARAQEPKKEYAQEYHQPFKGHPEKRGDLALLGPDAEQCVKFDPDGLRIALPADYPRPRPGTGVITDFVVKGDFEITATFEILQEPKAGLTEEPTEVRLVVVPDEHAEPEVWHKANQNRASLSRQAAGRSYASRFLADSTRWNPDLPKDKWGNANFSNVELHTNQASLTEAKSGRLRLVRSGSMLFFYTSEDSAKEFNLLHKNEFGTKDLKNVRILASTRGPAVAFEVRVTDLWIRADAFAKPSGAPPQPAVEAARRGWWVILAAIAVPLVAIPLALGAWLYVRMRNRAAPVEKRELAAGASPVIAFECPGCGKRLKANAERSGSKLKCPQCGKAVAVPTSEADDLEELP
jgi:ribosomal protein S27E